MLIKCTKRIPMGFFAINVGTLWKLSGVAYDEIPKKSIVRITEQNEDGVWAEIPQSVLAECFELA